MNRRFNKFWDRASSRRFISLFITVIWLATALQPCVMASVVDSGPSDVSAHHSMNMPSDSADTESLGCPHCKTATVGSDHCDPQFDEVCDEDESLVSDSRIKPVDNEQFDSQTQSLAVLSSRDYEFNSYSSSLSATSKSLTLPAGPPLRDLYRVYLK